MRVENQNVPEIDHCLLSSYFKQKILLKLKKKTDHFCRGGFGEIEVKTEVKREKMNFLPEKKNKPKNKGWIETRVKKKIFLA